MTSGSPTDEIKSKLDIVEVVSEYLQLKKAGASLRANCPFHHEKTPSFFVSPDRQIWHCFGCGEGGDIFGFVMRMEGLEFPDALRLLADRAGVKLSRQDAGASSERRRLIDANTWAARFFREVLVRSPQAEAARGYLKRRGLTEETADEFSLGFAPDSWDATSTFLRKKGFSDQEIYKAGLSQQKERGTGYFDRFRGRLMFPIRDGHGSVVGFTGRILPGPDGQEPDLAKYVNTQQTLVYNKGRILYGLDRAKQEIRRQGTAVIVEGNTDVISSHQAGVRNVVASSGTALTVDQLGLLRRLAERLVFSFDDDAAGENAARRGIGLALGAGFSVRVLELPPDAGKDPDDCIRRDPSLWKAAIEEARPYMEWLIGRTRARLDLSDPEQKKKAATDLLAETSRMPDPVERSHWIRELAGLLATPEGLLHERVEELRRRAAPSRPTARTAPDRPAEGPVKRRSRHHMVSEHLLGLTLCWPEYAESVLARVKPAYLHEELRQLYTDFIVFYNERRHGDGTSAFRLALEQGGNRDIARQVGVLEIGAEKEFGALTQEDRREMLMRLIGEIKELYIGRRKHELMLAMSEAEKAGDMVQITSIQQQINELML